MWVGVMVVKRAATRFGVVRDSWAPELPKLVVEHMLLVSPCSAALTELGIHQMYSMLM